MPEIKPTYDQAVVDALIAEAVAKERERCAKFLDEAAQDAKRSGDLYIISDLESLDAAIRVTPPAQQEGE